MTTINMLQHIYKNHIQIYIIKNHTRVYTTLKFFQLNLNQFNVILICSSKTSNDAKKYNILSFVYLYVSNMLSVRFAKLG